MIVQYDREVQRYPIKIWTGDLEAIEPGCLEQAVNLSNLPFIHKHVALMPDTHQGYGMPIGGVIACEKAIIPNAVGVDIGCGMSFVQTNIPARLLTEIETPNGILGKAVAANIMRNVPIGFERHDKMQSSGALDSFEYSDSDEQRSRHLKLYEGCFPNAYYQLGTLGGGNHFIELQEDEEGNIGIMLHSGSRNLGKQICDHFNRVARTLNERWFSVVPTSHELAFLPTESPEGVDYIAWMNLALDFARENRDRMMVVVQDILFDMIGRYVGTGYPGNKTGLAVNCHHNYATMENHFGKNVWVHRKGAIRAREGEVGIVPGAMGSYSYVIRGKENPESFHSCSHGAGRRCSRSAAKKEFSVEYVITSLKQDGVIIGKQNKSNVAEEFKGAYKDIDEVVNQEMDLLEPIKKLKTVVVVKG